MNLEGVLDQIKSNEITILMGDLNAKIGKSKYEDTIGEYGLGLRNERGDVLARFCMEKGRDCEYIF